MQAEAPVAAGSQGFAASSLLWLQVMVVAVGALLFAFVPEAVQHPLIAAAALAALTISMLLARSIPALERPLTRQHWFDLVAMLVSITLLAAATGGVRSSLMPLYIAPLAGA